MMSNIESVLKYRVENCKCRDSKGNFGSYSIVEITTGNKIGCHSTYSGACAAVRAILSAEDPDSPDISDEDVKLILEDRLKMDAGLGCLTEPEIMQHLMSKANDHKKDFIEKTVDELFDPSLKDPPPIPPCCPG